MFLGRLNAILNPCFLVKYCKNYPGLEKFPLRNLQKFHITQCIEEAAIQTESGVTG